MSAIEWIVLLFIVGGFSAVIESRIRQSERRIIKKLDQMHDQVIGLCIRSGVDPVDPLSQP